MPTSENKLVDYAIYNESRFSRTEMSDLLTARAIWVHNSYTCMHLLMHLSKNAPGTYRFPYILENLRSVIDTMVQISSESFGNFKINQSQHPLLPIIPDLLPTPWDVESLIK